MKRLLCLFLSLLFVLLQFTSCAPGTVPDDPPATTGADGATVYDVIFITWKEIIKVPTRENEIPVPPVLTDENVSYSTVDKNYTFKGWDKELIAPTAAYMAKNKQMVYYALYNYETRYYTVTFRVGENEYPVSVEAKTMPACPVTPEASGQIFTGWDKELAPATEDVAYTAKFMSADCPASFTVATWNIGHFANGNAANSRIGDADYGSKSQDYRDYISGLGADLLCLNEYSRFFTTSQNHPASEALFEETPPIAFVGEQRHFSCNAVFSSLPLQNLQVHEYECNKNAVVLYSNTNKAYFYYYITGELVVGGETVHFVFTHLAFDEDRTPDTVCQAQIDELIELYKDKEHVVMMGDWNAYHKYHYDPFADNGYTLGNYCEILTCIGSATGGLEWAVDDIIVKGLTMTDFHAVNTGLSDHIAVVATLTLTQP